MRLADFCATLLNVHTILAAILNIILAQHNPNLCQVVNVHFEANILSSRIWRPVPIQPNATPGASCVTSHENPLACLTLFQRRFYKSALSFLRQKLFQRLFYKLALTFVRQKLLFSSAFLRPVDSTQYFACLGIP